MQVPVQGMPLPLEVLTQVADAAQPLNRMCMRLGSRAMADAMSPLNAGEMIIQMLQAALKAYVPGAHALMQGSFVEVSCYCPPGPQREIRFVPRNRKRFWVTYQGPQTNVSHITLPSQRFQSWHGDVLLKRYATLREAMLVLEELGCIPKNARLYRPYGDRWTRRHFVREGLRNRGAYDQESNEDNIW